MDLSCSLAPWDNWEWPRAVATSGHFCADLLLTAYDGEVQLYLLSLSRWALVVQVADNMLQLYCTASGLDALPTNDPKEFEEVPDAVSSSVALFATSQPLSFLVVVWYWGFEHWGHQEMPSYLGFFLHFISWILQLISLMVCRIPLSCSHGGWLLAFVTSFIVWSYVHYALRIGMPGGCRSYTQPECPMYSALDWHKPQVAATTAFCALAAAALAVFLYALLAKLRGLSSAQWDLLEMDNNRRIEREAQQARELEALKAALEEEQQGYCFCRCR